MRIYTIAPPASEPITLDDVKAWLRIDSADEDNMLAMLISAARVSIEAHLNRPIVSQGRRCVLDDWPDVVRQSKWMFLPVAPVISIDAIRVYTSENAPQIIDPTSYALLEGGEYGVISFATAPMFPGRPKCGVEIDLTCGYRTLSEIPANLKQSMLDLIACLFENRGDISLAQSASKISSASLPELRRMRLT